MCFFTVFNPSLPPDQHLFHLHFLFLVYLKFKNFYFIWFIAGQNKRFYQFEMNQYKDKKTSKMFNVLYFKQNYKKKGLQFNKQQRA